MSDILPGDLQPGFERVKPRRPLWDLAVAVADRASLTAEQDTPSYIGVRPAAHGAIAGYVNRSCVDLQLIPERAKQLALAKGWQLRGVNGYTRTLRVPALELEDERVMAEVVELFVDALDKSAACTPFEGGGASVRQYAAQQPICPVHAVEMLGGVCDRCG